MMMMMMRSIHCSPSQLLRSGGEATLEKIGKNAEGASQLGILFFFQKTLNIG